MCSGGGGGRLSCEAVRSSIGSRGGGGGGGNESRLSVELNIPSGMSSVGGGGGGKSSTGGMFKGCCTLS